MPFAHELSEESREESPWKLLPYPREVGTQMTGLPTRPPTTEKNAPSIPATAITTSARSMSSSRDSSRTTPATPMSGRSREEIPTYSSVRRASSATGTSAVPAGSTATSPGIFGLPFPTRSTSVPDFSS